MAGEPGGRRSGKRTTELLIGLGVTPVCAHPELYSYVFSRDAACEALAAHRERAAVEADR